MSNIFYIFHIENQKKTDDSYNHATVREKKSKIECAIGRLE